MNQTIDLQGYIVLESHMNRLRKMCIDSMFYNGVVYLSTVLSGQLAQVGKMDAGNCILRIELNGNRYSFDMNTETGWNLFTHFYNWWVDETTCKLEERVEEEYADHLFEDDEDFAIDDEENECTE